MTKTRSDLITRTLQYIGAQAANAVTDGEDATLIGDVVDSVYERLQEEGVVTFDLNTIPNRVYMPLVHMTGAEAAGDFGFSEQKIARLSILGVSARAEFYRTQAHEPTDESVKTVYY
ncbi:MAG: hypothetical protein KAV87_48275 [Desulfobacteraceae bacterium]|nr:hypothetical protein [Desulfobacteraceae bacterium]